MPSTTLQTRIQAFEALSNGNNILEGPLSPLNATTLQPVALINGSRPQPPQPSPSPSPPNLGRRTSLIDLHDWVVADGEGNRASLGGSLSPSPSSSKTPTQQSFKPNPKPKPTTLSMPFKSPPKLPPRNTSYTSLQSYASSSSSPPTAASTSTGGSDSLTVEHAHRYPPLSAGSSRNANSNGGGGNHFPSSSISSFHSVSLSSDTDPSTPGSMSNFIATFPMDEGDSTSLSESYEDVSISSIASPATERTIARDWEKAMAKRKPVPPWDPNGATAAAKRVPPKLPERPKVTPPPSYPVSRSSSYNTTPTSLNSPILPYTPRRAAPPPPPSRSSDRASIQSTNSYASSSRSPSILSLNINLNAKTKRPTPVPAAARRRYDILFTENVIQRRRAEKQKQEEKPSLLSPVEARGRRAAGWRGLSVDLITGDSLATPSSPPQNNTVDETVGNDEKLEGSIVKLIWKRSKLSNAQLADIWNECDITGQGALSREAFVKGMWRIDEELRRAQSQAIKAATNGSNFYRSSSLRSLPSKTTTRSRDILR